MGGQPDSAREQARRALADKGWTQRRLARELGVSRGTVSRWLSGARTPSLRMAVRVHELLGVPEDAWVTAT